MKTLLAFLTFASFGMTVFGQTDFEDNLGDTVFHFVTLKIDTSKTSVLCCSYRNIDLYFPYADFKAECFKQTGEEGKLLQNKVALINKNLKVSELDTSITKIYQFKYVADKLIRKGSIALFDKKKKVFVKKISYRLERYGTTASRVFYLPDNRNFFMVMIFSGILDSNNLFSNPEDLKREYDKLNSEGK